MVTQQANVGGNGNGEYASREGVSELLLRFPCPACQQAINAPLRSIGVKTVCLHCRTPIQIPSLDCDVIGLETVRRVFEPAHSAASHDDGRQAAATSVLPRMAEPPRREEPAATAASPPPSLPPMPSRYDSSRPESFDGPATSNDEFGHDRQPVYDGRQRESLGGGLHFPRAAHWICRAIYWITLIVLFFSISINPGFVGIVFLLWLIPHIGWKIAEFITSLLVTTIACPGCGEVYPCVEVWKCACGYQDHQQKHVINFRCPSCHSRLGHANCRRCGATILIW